VKGGKADKAAKEAKRQEDLARKAENARALAEEEAAAPAKVKAAPKAGAKKATPKPAGPGAIAAGGALPGTSAKGNEDESVETYSATGLDNMLDLLDVVTAKTDKASVGTQAAGIEKHPEVCSFDAVPFEIFCADTFT
jgi:membrane protein involved in colicin uptake